MRLLAALAAGAELRAHVAVGAGGGLEAGGSLEAAELAAGWQRLVERNAATRAPADAPAGTPSLSEVAALVEAHVREAKAKVDKQASEVVSRLEPHREADEVRTALEAGARRLGAELEEVAAGARATFQAHASGDWRSAFALHREAAPAANAVVQKLGAAERRLVARADAWDAMVDKASAGALAELREVVHGDGEGSDGTSADSAGRPSSADDFVAEMRAKMRQHERDAQRFDDGAARDLTEFDRAEKASKDDALYDFVQIERQGAVLAEGDAVKRRAAKAQRRGALGGAAPARPASPGPASWLVGELQGFRRGVLGLVQEAEDKVREAATGRAIPAILHFTYKQSLLEARYTDGATRDAQLADNVHHTVLVNKAAHDKTMFWDDEQCRALLATAPYGDTLLSAFNRESHGMFKGDICRGAALYKYGGWYLDVDLLARQPVAEVARPDTTFVSCFENSGGGLFNALMAATPRHPVIRDYLKALRDNYTGQKSLLEVGDGKLGVQALMRAYEQHEAALGTTAVLLEEVHAAKAGVPGLSGALKQRNASAEVWFRDVNACDFAIYDPVSKRVPFYSRVATHVSDMSAYCACCDTAPLRAQLSAVGLSSAGI